MGELQFGANLGKRIEQSPGATTRVGNSKSIEPRRYLRREPAVALNRIYKIEDQEWPSGRQRLDRPEVEGNLYDFRGEAETTKCLRYGEFSIEGVIRLALGRTANNRDEASLPRQSSKPGD
jgi:hypothetical protein